MPGCDRIRALGGGYEEIPIKLSFSQPSQLRISVPATLLLIILKMSGELLQSVRGDPSLTRLSAAADHQAPVFLL